MLVVAEHEQLVALHLHYDHWLHAAAAAFVKSEQE